MIPGRRETQAPNVLEMIPAHAVDFEHHNGVTHLRVPKIKHKWLKCLEHRLKQPYYMIHLDEYGTRVWNLMDDRLTVFDIGDKLQKEYGEKIAPVYERLGLFINMLAQRHFITLRSIDGADG